VSNVLSSLPEIKARHQAFKSAKLDLDLTRGKPSSAQLDLASQIDHVLNDNYQSRDGIDTRNYGGLDGLPEAKALGAMLLDVPASQVLVGGNASLTLMYQTVSFKRAFDANWQGDIKFICPVPGYDRHFSICEALGIEMVPVAMTPTGPDTDAIAAILENDRSIRGIWCVPKYQNPTGVTYSDHCVNTLVELANTHHFDLFWDNAYAVHHFDPSDTDALQSVWEVASQRNATDRIWCYGSTSKITHAGSGLAFLASSDNNLAWFKSHLGVASIGPDKVNQLRHVRFFEQTPLDVHMAKHAKILKPRIDCVLNTLDQNLSHLDGCRWDRPKGGYFVCFYSPRGIASRIVELAADVGVKLTPAGATHPYGNDPDDSVIRIAPSYPEIEALEQAMQVFCHAVEYAVAEQIAK